MGKKIKCIEGIRTFGWFGVFLCHFKGSFFPGVSWITDSTPIRFIYSENAYVRLLFVISGFVLSNKYFTKEEYEGILGDIIKRYFRLMPPVLFCELLVWLFMELGCMRNAEVAEIVGSSDFLGIFNQFQPNLATCLHEGLLGAYFRGGNEYIGPLWTLVYEYLGAILILCALYILKKSSWRWLFYLISLMVFSNYYNYFVLGMLVCDLYVNADIAKYFENSTTLRIISIIAGYLLLSMIGLDDNIKATRVIFASGIIFFMLGVLSSNVMERILGNRVMLEGGKLAYSAYIIHWPIVETFSCGLALLLVDKNIPYRLMTLIIFGSTFVVILIFSKFISVWIEPIGTCISRKLIVND